VFAWNRRPVARGKWRDLVSAARDVSGIVVSPDPSPAWFRPVSRGRAAARVPEARPPAKWTGGPPRFPPPTPGSGENSSPAVPPAAPCPGRRFLEGLVTLLDPGPLEWGPDGGRGGHRQRGRTGGTGEGGGVARGCWDSCGNTRRPWVPAWPTRQTGAGARPGLVRGDGEGGRDDVVSVTIEPSSFWPDNRAARRDPQYTRQLAPSVELAVSLGGRVPKGKKREDGGLAALLFFCRGGTGTWRAV